GVYVAATCRKGPQISKIDAAAQVFQRHRRRFAAAAHSRYRLSQRTNVIRKKTNPAAPPMTRSVPNHIPQSCAPCAQARLDEPTNQNKMTGARVLVRDRN